MISVCIVSQLLRQLPALSPKVALYRANMMTVTVVGATQEFEPEVPAFREPGIGFDGRDHGYYASGSGFSNYFPRPAYQDGVVPAYVKALNGEYEGLYNPSKFPNPNFNSASDVLPRWTRLPRRRSPRSLLCFLLERNPCHHLRNFRLLSTHVFRPRTCQRRSHRFG